MLGLAASVGGGIAMAVACNCYGTISINRQPFCTVDHQVEVSQELPDGGFEMCCPGLGIVENRDCPERDAGNSDAGDAGIDAGDGGAPDAGVDAGREP